MTDSTRNETDPYQLLPGLSSDEYESLRADIAANGQRDPIVLRAGTGEIVDGHHRLRACQELSVDPLTVEVWFDTDLEASAYALRVNTARRQLSQHQLRDVRDRQKTVYFELRSRPGCRQEDTAAEVGVPAGTAARWESEAKKATEPDFEPTTNLRAKNGGKDDGSAGEEEQPEPPAKPQDNRVKLTDEQKDHIYLLATKHGWTQQAIADDYKVSQQAISNVVNERRKRHKKEQHRRELEAAAAAADLARIEPAELTIEPGTWIELGPHRLYCGDSASDDFIAAAQGATFAFADPPYNADAATWDTGFIWDHDYLADIAPVVAVTPGISAIPDFMRRTTMPYAWSMAAHVSNGMTRGAVGFGNWIYVALFATVSVYRRAQDHHTVTVGSHPSDDDHKGRKPPKLLAWLIDLYTEPGDLVVDPFAGSGTTLFVADELGRRCVTAEIDPTYCAQIVATYRNAEVAA